MLADVHDKTAACPVWSEDEVIMENIEISWKSDDGTRCKLMITNRLSCDIL